MIIKNILKGALVSSLYMYAIVLSRTPFDFYLAYLVFTFLIVFSFIIKSKLFISIKAVIIFFSIGMIQLIVSLYVGSDVLLGIKQMFLIGFTLFSFFVSFKALDFDLISIFKTYYFSVFFVSVIILLQQVAYVLGITFLYDLSWILNSSRIELTEFELTRTGGLIQEPAYYIYVSFPVVYFAFDKFLF